MKKLLALLALVPFVGMGQNTIPQSQIPTTNVMGAADTFLISSGPGHSRNITPPVAAAALSPFITSQAGVTTNLGALAATNGAVTSIGADYKTFGLDSNAVWYCSQVGVTNIPDIVKVSGFIATLKKKGLYSHLKDAYLGRTNLNNNTLQTFFGNYGTNCGSTPAVFGREGVYFDGSSQGLLFPMPALTTHSVIMGLRGTTNEPANGSTIYACPWEMVNAGGYTVSSASVIMGNNYGSNPQLYTRQGATATQLAGWTPLGYSFLGYNSNDPRYRTLGVGYNASTPNYVGYVDGRVSATLGPANVTTVSSPLTLLSVGCRIVTPPSTIDFYWQGVISYWTVFDIVLSAQNIADLEDAFRYLDPWSQNRVFVGDSLTAWIYNDAAGNSIPYRDWVTRWTDQQGTNEDYRNYNIAQSGETAHGWSLNTSFPQQYAPKGAVKAAKAYVLLGVNDLYLGTNSANNFDPVGFFWPGLSNVWFSLKSSGFQVIGSTISCVWSNPAWSPSAWNQVSAMEQGRMQYNFTIITNAYLIDEVKPLHLLFSLDDMATNATTPLSRDGLHWFQDLSGGTDPGPSVGAQRVSQLMFGQLKPTLYQDGRGIYTSTNYYTNGLVNGSLILLNNGALYTVSNNLPVQH